MSLKSIEMQVALPRTQDFGKVQEQLNQRNMISQHQDSTEQKVKTVQERTQIAQANKTEDRMITSEEEASGGRQQSDKNKKEQQEKEKNNLSPHPYKGKHIDLSL